MKTLGACLKALSRMARPQWWRLCVSIAVGALRIAASMGFVMASKHLVDIATGVDGSPIGPAIGLFLGILAVQLGCVIFSSWWTSYITVKAQNGLRRSCFAHVMRSRWEGREPFLSGDTVNRLEEDIRVIADLLCDRIPGLVITLLQLLCASAYLMILAPNLLWVLIILMAAAVLGSRMFFRQLRRLMAVIRQRESELQQLMQESLLHRVLVLTLTGVERVLTRFGWIQADIEGNVRKRLNYNAVARGLMFLGFQAGHAAAFLWGVFGIMAGTVTYGTMTAFLQLVGQVQRPIAEFGRQVPAFINAMTSIERIMELEELPEEPAQAPLKLEDAPEIVLENVSYSYPGADNPVLENFSCSFPAGKMSVVAGPTGAGKSTLVRLVLGLLRPTEGRVFVGGHEASAALRCNFMYLPQGNSLLSGTIRDNLMMADPDASDDQMYEALDSAMAGFVRELPDGLDSVCGEIGSGLSEGQCQRIAVARALLRSGGVLILDEATSALDSDTEKTLLEKLNARFRGRKTIVFISHREAVIDSADAVVRV